MVKSIDLKSAAAKQIGVGDDSVFALRSNGEIDEIDAVEMTVKRTHKHGVDATCMAYSGASKEIWIGDKKGLIHVLSVADFSTVQKIEKHTKTVTCISVSADGTQIASGDGYRYQYVWDATSREQKGEYGFQKDKITSLSFSKDGTKLVSTSTDLALGVVDLATGVSKLKKNPHDVKQVSRAVITSNNEIYSSGEDCVIRIWTGF